MEDKLPIIKFSTWKIYNKFINLPYTESIVRVSSSNQGYFIFDYIRYYASFDGGLCF